MTIKTTYLTSSKPIVPDQLLREACAVAAQILVSAGRANEHLAAMLHDDFLRCYDLILIEKTDQLMNQARREAVQKSFDGLVSELTHRRELHERRWSSVYALLMWRMAIYVPHAIGTDLALHAESHFWDTIACATSIHQDRVLCAVGVTLIVPNEPSLLPPT